MQSEIMIPVLRLVGYATLIPGILFLIAGFWVAKKSSKENEILGFPKDFRAETKTQASTPQKTLLATSKHEEIPTQTLPEKTTEPELEPKPKKKIIRAIISEEEEKAMNELFATEIPNYSEWILSSNKEG